MCRRDSNRLNSIGSQGRNELRNLIILAYDNPYDPHCLHTAEIFDLPLMYANPALTIKTNIGDFSTLDSGGFIMKLHGYGQCGTVEMANVFEEDCKHRFQSVC